MLEPTRLIKAAGLAWAVVFIVVGLASHLQLYADGSLFSYAIADRASWAMHWHNIAQRSTAHVLVHMPAEAYVSVTRDAPGGIAVYGGLFFGAPLAGLALTWVLDRTTGQIHTLSACLATSLLAPLLFGFPSELWLSLALVWPVMASLHGPRRWPWPVPLLLLLALAFTHEGGLLLALTGVAMLALRGWRDGEFLRALVMLAIAAAAWSTVKLAVPPDAYFASAYMRSAASFVDLGVVTRPAVVEVAAAAGGYVVLAVLLARLGFSRPAAGAACLTIAAVGLAGFVFDLPVHAADRYPVRTVVLGGVVVLVVAAAAAPWSARLAEIPKTGEQWQRLGLGLMASIMAVHAIETARFVRAWGQYEDGVRALASGEASDPQLGNDRFVNSERLGDRLNRLSWYSTTHYLSVLLAPGFSPRRLVVDPDAGYYWLSCGMAKASEARASAIAAGARELVRIHACLHRQ